MLSGNACARAKTMRGILFGCLNRLRSSRRLEAQRRRNLEVRWLLDGLVPS
jgi:transposase